MNFVGLPMTNTANFANLLLIHITIHYIVRTLRLYEQVIQVISLLVSDFFRLCTSSVLQRLKKAHASDITSNITEKEIYFHCGVVLFIINC